MDTQIFKIEKKNSKRILPRWLYFGDFYSILIDWFIKLSVQTFQLLIKTGEFCVLSLGMYSYKYTSIISRDEISYKKLHLLILIQ